MSQTVRTIIFVAVAAVSVGAAALVTYQTAPQPLDQFEKVGGTFYDDFQIADAGLLELTAIPEGESKPQTFRVDFSDGLWRIQSHHGYPAEANKRLAETAASVIGVRRIALAGRGVAQHERFGVVDPEKKDLADPKAAGARIRILGKDKTALVDLIIGKRADESALKTAARRKNPADAAKPLHYVRRPDEQDTYLARIDLKVSTKFSDWIEPDLLKLKGEDLRKIEIHNYQVRYVPVDIGGGRAMRRAVKFRPITLILSRDQQWDPWKLKGLNDKSESLNTEKVTDLVSVLDDMKLLGVSPRLKRNGQAPLTGDLQLKPPKSIADDLKSVVGLIRDVVGDLDEKGFSLEFDPQNFTVRRVRELLKTKGAIPAQLLSQNGEFAASTKDGLVYHLHFGSIVEGTGKEIELGGTAKKESKPKKTGKKKSGNARKPDESKDETHRRYVLIRVEFDAKAMDNQPTKPKKPVEPKKPPGYKEPPKKPAAKKPVESMDEKPVMALKPGQTEPPAVAGRPNPDAHFRYEQQKYKDDLKQYQSDLKLYAEDKKEFDKRGARSKTFVKQLNERFAGWYYVVSTQSLQQLTLSRDQLVEKGDKKKPRSKFPPFRIPGR